MRYALYFTPDRSHPLTATAAAWLGRDAFSNASIPAVDIDDLAAKDISRWTAEPRRYGFHGTLAAPFRLKSGFGERDIVHATEAFAAKSSLVPGQRLKIATLGRFVALVPAASGGELEALATAAVDHFGILRAPLTDEDIARRNPERLTARQRRYLDLYGYPYVKDEFRFHMTLTGPMAAPDIARIEPVLHRLLARALATPVDVDAVALFVEQEPGAPFTVHSTYRLPAKETREIVCHAP